MDRHRFRISAIRHVTDGVLESAPEKNPDWAPEGLRNSGVLAICAELLLMIVPSATPSPAAFSLRRYQAHEHEIALHMSHFFLDYLKNLYREFEGDLAMVIVLAEIAHHSTSGCFTPGPGSGSAMRLPTANDLPSCSAYSLAAATGLPRETVRRKIARLSDRGWVEKAGRAEVRLTAKVAEYFTPDFNIRLLDSLLETSDRIRGVLASE